MSTIAIIGAMDEEVANIASALSDITVTEEAGVSVTRGTIETNKGTRVNVAATVGGMGTVNIAATTQHLIDADQPGAVIFSGIAIRICTSTTWCLVARCATSTPTCVSSASGSQELRTSRWRNSTPTTA